MSGHFPGNISLIEQLDKQVLVVLRDGRHLVGYIRSFDQYSNIILQDTFERHIVEGMFCDIELGLYIVRGDNIIILGELDEIKEQNQPHLKRVSVDEILEAEARLQEKGATNFNKEKWDFDGSAGYENGS